MLEYLEWTTTKIGEYNPKLTIFTYFDRYVTFSSILTALWIQADKILNPMAVISTISTTYRALTRVLE